jgi:predicted dehydrogenase
MGDQASGWTETFEFDCERNDMFLAAAREFLELLKGGGTPRCSIEDGVNVLRVVEAIRTSCAAGKTIELGRN